MISSSAFVVALGLASSALYVNTCTIHVMSLLLVKYSVLTIVGVKTPSPAITPSPTGV